MSSPSVSAEPPYAGAPPDASSRGTGGRTSSRRMFLAPAVILLGVWILYPLVYTVWRSFYDRSGANFIWLDNYRTLFTTDTTRTAIKNNAIWVAVVPALVTAIGLIFAVLTERIRWSVAFKIGRLHADGGVALRRRRDLADHVPAGAVARSAQRRHRVGRRQGPAARPALGRLPSGAKLTGTPQTGIVLRTPVRPGSVALLRLTGIPPDQVPAGSVQARQPAPKEGAVTGVVWRDFKPGGGTPGKLERGRWGSRT